MTHSDDTGLVLPPSIAPVQVVITPIWKGDAERVAVLAFAERVRAALSPRFRVTLDERDTLKPGAKYFEWERRGVPLRLEVGPRDVQQGAVFAAPRVGVPSPVTNYAPVTRKFPLPLEGLGDNVWEVLDRVQKALLSAAEARLAARTSTPASYAAFAEALEQGGFFLVPWHDDPDAEARIKEETKATIRCFPLDGQDAALGATCFYSGRPADRMALFARAY
jgi:prolyl-tRNA synthetase